VKDPIAQRQGDRLQHC